MNDTLFYFLGAGLAVLAVLTSFVGLRVSRFPASGAVMGATIAIFLALVGATTTFAVLNGQDEQEARASELEKANEEVEEAELSPVEGGEEGAAGQQAPTGGAAEEKQEVGEKQAGTGGAGGTLKLAADPSAIAFDTTTLSSKAGKVTIDFDNPSPLEHNVAIEKDGKELAVSDTIAQGKTSVSADLEPGTYTFLCTVPGHAEAGMEGTLTVR